MATRDEFAFAVLYVLEFLEYRFGQDVWNILWTCVLTSCQVVEHNQFYLTNGVTDLRANTQAAGVNYG